MSAKAKYRSQRNDATKITQEHETILTLKVAAWQRTRDRQTAKFRST
jgi:hypothetical protein